MDLFMLVILFLHLKHYFVKLIQLYLHLMIEVCMQAICIFSMKTESK